MTDHAAQDALLFAARRMLATKRAEQHLLDFMKLTMPDPQDIDDASMSRYEETPVARLLCQIMEKVYSRQLKRVCVSVGPQLGKSQVISRGGPAWMLAKNPYLNIILGTYNQPFANEFGDAVREIMNSPSARQIFEGVYLRKGGKAKDLLITMSGGRAAFVGRGGSGTGKPADIFIVDDPLKDDIEAQSDSTREEVWNWFNKVALTRCHDKSSILVVHCMTGDTPVLLPDGGEKPLRDIRPGDAIATYHAGQLAVSSVLNWRNNGPDKVFAIKTRSGAVVKANERHPFLVIENGQERWTRTKDLRLGHAIVRVSGANGKARPALAKGAISPSCAGDTAPSTTTKNDGSTACGHPPSTRELIETGTLSTDMGSRWSTTPGCSPSKTASAPSAADRRKETSPSHGRGSLASTTVTTAPPSAGSCATRATSQLETSELPKSRKPSQHTYDFTTDEIVEIVEFGVEDVFDIQVEATENFIANGLVSHNTRWHQDDLIGRLCDPDHPERNGKYKGIAERWTHINLPAVVDDPKLAKALGLTLEPPTDPFVISMFGTKPMSSLWPSRKGLPFLAEAKQQDKAGFGALYMGQPTPEDGDYFKAADLVEYNPEDLPDSLTIYGASDHAVGLKQRNDSTVLGCIGVDEKDDIWVLPSLVWGKMPTDQTVEELIQQFKNQKPMTWWMESEMISKSFGPFLLKRMEEEGVYTPIEPVIASKDKSTRGRSIQGRIQMRKVHFPRDAVWWPEARRQMLMFPNGAHDDFVDWLGHIGQGLMKQIAPDAKVMQNERQAVRTGSIEWILRRAQQRADRENAEKRAVGW